MPKTSSIRPVVSIQYRLVTDEHTDGHMTTAYIAPAKRRAVKKTTHGNSTLIPDRHFVMLYMLTVYIYS